MNKGLFVGLIVFIIAALIGALVSVVIMSNGKMAFLSSEYTSALSTPILYGTVVGKNSDETAIRVRSPNRYEASGEPAAYDINVGGAEVYYQYLISEQGVFTSLSEPKKSTVGDIPVGSTVVAFVRYHNRVGPISADRIYFGDPL